MKTFLRTYGPSLASGVALGLAFPSWHLFPLAWVALIPLFRAARRRTPRGNALHFFLAGWAFHCIVLQWLMANTMVAGGWAFWGYQALCVVMALYWAAFGFACAWAGARLHPIARPWAAAFLWATMEYLQGALFGGFGWSSLGYSQGPDFALLQIASVGGGLLISWVLIFVNAAAGEALASARARFGLLASAAAVALAAHLGGYALIGVADTESRPLVAGVFQSDFSLDMKWDSEYSVDMVRNAVNKSLTLDKHGDIDIMFWPEALVMDDIDNPEILDGLRRQADVGKYWLFTGSQRTDFSADPEVDGKSYFSYNSSYLVSPEGDIQDHYDKIDLAPFGEYVPFSKYFPFIGTVVPAIGAMDAGHEVKTFEAAGRTFGPLICFEVLFPTMAETLRDEGVDYLAVITNLAWFGRTNAIPQELEIARVRAVETRLPLVHSANTGISGVFDPYGRLSLMNAAVDSRGNLRELVADLTPNETVLMRLLGVFALPAPAARPVPYGPVGFPWLSIALSLAFATLAYVRNKPTPGEEPPTVD